MKDREQMERCLQAVGAYEASGQKASDWCEVNGVAVRELASWCAHARRWRAKLGGVAAQPARQARGGFVAAALASGSSATLRVEMGRGAMAVVLHWPLSHVGELAAWLREVTR
jgi:hypothetical protein